MVRFKLLYVLLLLFTTSLFAQDARYTAALQEIAGQLASPRETAEFQELDRKLERIAAAAPNEWLPLYHRAYIQLRLAGTALEGPDKKAAGTHRELAQTLLDQAKKLDGGDNSEVAALQAQLYMTYLQEDPMANGPTYSMLTHQTLAQAEKLDPANPRVHLLRGMILLYTPPMYGGGAKSALPSLEKAQELFAAQPTEGLGPRWGVGMNAYLLGEARGQAEGKTGGKEDKGQEDKGRGDQE